MDTPRMDEVAGVVRGDLAIGCEVPYRDLFEASDIATFLMRGPACVVCNSAGARLFGVAGPRDMVGKTPLDFAPALQPNGMESSEMVADNFEQAQAKGTHAFEWLTSKADGQAILIEVRFTMLPNTAELYLCSAIDISDRKRRELALAESETRFRTIFDNAVEGILVADAETQRFKFANPAVCQLLGYDRAGLIGLEIRDIHPREEMPGIETDVELWRIGIAADTERICLRKDGTRIPVSIRTTPLEIASHNYLAGFFTDLTARRQLDEERLKRQKLEAVGRLAGGIAHDFNNLLQGVFGFLSLARLTHRDKVQSLAMIGKAEKALQQSVHLTTQLLTFAKGGRPVTARLEVGPLVRSATSLALSGSRADCRIEIADDLAAVEADEGQLTQVLHNVVLNAAQAMPLGGTVHVAAMNVHSASAQLPPLLTGGRFVAIVVKDFGVGIPLCYLSKIFDPYFTTKEKGTGLGLATAYSIINNHHGVIDVQSCVGEGSTFTIYLPATDANASCNRALGVPARRATRSVRILLMDDDQVVLSSTAALLESLGHMVDTAEHGEAAIEQYRRAFDAGSCHDLVILDLTVRGGLGGVDCARRLRAFDPDVRILVSSGYSDEIASAEYAGQRFLAFLKKPFDLTTLEATLAQVMTEET